MQVGGQEFSSEILGRIRQMVADDPGISRRKLSQQVCEWLNWRTSRGSLQEGSCRKALVELHRQSVLTLPETVGNFSFEKPRPSFGVAGIDIAVPDICCSLGELGEIEVVPVTSRYCKDSRVWRVLLDTYHYLYYGGTKEPPRTPPTMIQAARMVGIIGGHMGRVRDGMPGTECIWRGLQRLDVAVDMYTIFKHEPIPRLRKFYPYALLPPNSGP